MIFVIPVQTLSLSDFSQTYKPFRHSLKFLSFSEIPLSFSMAKDKKGTPTTNDVEVCLKEQDYNDVVNVYGLTREWEPERPASGSITTSPPPNKMAVYVDHFTTGNFRIPITKFVASVLTTYGVHLSQIHPFGM